jgi:hypothetical protein
MTFVVDIQNAISLALQNPGPAPALGPEVPITIPIGRWKVQTDGVVLLQVAEGAINPDLAEVLFPEMAEFVFAAKVPVSLVLQMANVGTSRVNFYPEAPDEKNVKQIRSGEFNCL